MADDDGKGGTPESGGTPDKPADKGGTPDAAEDVTGLKAALAAERAKARRADALERELEELKAGNATEAEKALTAARKEGEKAADAKWQERVRAIEVRGALRGAGIANERFLALAVHSDEFSSLAVDPDGNVSGITEAVALFKKNVPEAFAAAGAGEAGGSKDEKPKVPPVASGVQANPDEGIKPGYDRLTQAYAELDAAKSRK